MTAAAVLPALLAGHFVGDWIVQTDWQAANKVRPAAGRFSRDYGAHWRTWYPGAGRPYFTSWKANQQHMLGYHLTLASAVAFVVSWPALLTILIVSWVTHSIIDRRWPVAWLMQHTGSGPFSQTTFGVIAVDQALHLSILCGLAAVAVR